MGSKSGGINEQTENDVQDWGRLEVDRLGFGAMRLAGK
jgi:hypothetical protein